MTGSSNRRLFAHLSMLAIAAFVGLSLWAKWSPVLGQEGGKKGKKTVDPAKKATKPAVPAAAPESQSLTKGKKVDAKELARIIDEAVNARLKAEGVDASEKSTDSEFLRRVHLDLVGTIPTVEKVKAFLEDKNPNKRDEMIATLLKDERFGKYHAEQWSGLMLPRDSNNRALNFAPLQSWLTESFNKNVPTNKMVNDLITATGSQDENGAVTYFVGNATVDKITDNVTRMFLGVQLQCAQCHNHPFVEWKQNEYWAMAAFFMKVRLNTTPQAAAKKGIIPGVSESATAPKGKKNALPESAKIVPAKFLMGAEPKLDPKEPYRPTLANWMTSKENPFFARAMVNRWWYTLFGRGLVNPVDDMHDENAASHPEVLDTLTEQFKLHDFDLNYLLAAICMSETYQRTSRPTKTNADDNVLYSHRLVRTLTPEQMYDSLITVVGTPGKAAKKDLIKDKVVAKKGPANPRDNFTAFFRIDEGADPLEYQTGIPQALRLMNSGALNSFGETVSKASAGSKEPAKVLENLYLATYARPPRDDELKLFTKYVTERSGSATAYGDVVWSLVNSSEFSFNH